VNDLVIKAAALALRKVPAANAAWSETAIRRFHDVDIAVAVAGPNGLITPVVRNADAKNLRQISAEMKALAARARESRLRPDEYRGGGFTVSNLGMHGIREFSAIINPPQACILAVGASEQRAVVRDGALAVATMMTCTLSVDHRAVDGALGAEFLAAFRKLIESPIALFV
jgi:pyruvate dehydrogenase E2 component (dihydrolipoamide acetyltransferase)